MRLVAEDTGNARADDARVVSRLILVDFSRPDGGRTVVTREHHTEPGGTIIRAAGTA